MPRESRPPGLYEQIVALCNLAFQEDLSELMTPMAPVVHVLARQGSEIVSHAMWVTRWLRVGKALPVQTAYVEMVATRPDMQRRGLASTVMRRLHREIPERYGLAALSTGSPGFYRRLGWREWEGPLSIRLPSGEVLDTPHDQVMVRAVPGHPEPDRTRPLSAEWREGELW